MARAEAAGPGVAGRSLRHAQNGPVTTQAAPGGTAPVACTDDECGLDWDGITGLVIAAAPPQVGGCPGGASGRCLTQSATPPGARPPPSGAPARALGAHGSPGSAARAPA